MKKLKCWKKIGKDEWLNQKKSNFLKVYFVKPSKKWSIRDAKSLAGYHSFKTKPQALKFAKLYMKKHNQC